MAGRKDWDPREHYQYSRIGALESLASQIVGDRKSPNVFFVTVEGRVVAITQDLEVAKRAWEGFAGPMDIETSIEDRLVGTLASITPDPEQEVEGLIRIENFDMLPESSS